MYQFGNIDVKKVLVIRVLSVRGGKKVVRPEGFEPPAYRFVVLGSVATRASLRLFGSALFPRSHI